MKSFFFFVCLFLFLKNTRWLSLTIDVLNTSIYLDSNKAFGDTFEHRLPFLNMAWLSLSLSSWKLFPTLSLFHKLPCVSPQPFILGCSPCLVHLSWSLSEGPSCGSHLPGTERVIEMWNFRTKTRKGPETRRSWLSYQHDSLSSHLWLYLIPLRLSVECMVIDLRIVSLTPMLDVEIT